MEKQNMPLFLGCPSMFLFARVTSNLKGKISSIFFPIKKKNSEKKNAHCMEKQSRE
jgi:hypothetical protein